MNIKQALKRKNILVDQIKQEYNRANTYNSIDSENTRPYSASGSLKKYFNLTEELITLKTSIHRANQPIYDKIFKLSEYKSVVKYLKAINCAEGKLSGNRWESPDSKVLVAEINIVARDKMVSEYEEKINTIQDELDYFNQITEI
jgi:hypothetical protein